MSSLLESVRTFCVAAEADVRARMQMVGGLLSRIDVRAGEGMGEGLGR